MDDDVSQIGRVSDAVGLSLRTICYYEEIGLISPSGHTNGGFRPYGQEDIDRLLLINSDPNAALGGGESPPYVDEFHAWATAHAGRLDDVKPGQLLHELQGNPLDQLAF